MDPLRFSAIAHGDLPFWNPVGEEAVDALLARLPLPERPRVLDAGCGRAGMLVRLAERRGAVGVGVDRSPFAAAGARAAAERPACGGRVTIREEDFDPSVFAAGSFDLALCVGSSHALGGAGPALGTLAGLVRSGGLVLLGEGFWRREPDPGYLAAIGGTREELLEHRGNESLGAGRGLDLLESLVTPDADFARYEDAYAANAERFAAAHPGDPDAPEFLRRIRPWRDAYLRWGRETLGFGLYLFRSAGSNRRA